MNVNPYKAFANSPTSEAKQSVDDDRPLPNSVADLRAERKRWNLRCYLLSFLFVVLAVALWGTSQVLLKKEVFWLQITNWISLLLFADGALCFVFGPIAWFWTGRHKRLRANRDNFETITRR
ncbi:MAG: hypothetical protein VYA84_01985 [Planctomycetota bacterium]|nr:hypothetical protein [Planctomycetota bacterium]